MTERTVVGTHLKGTALLTCDLIGQYKTVRVIADEDKDNVHR